MQLLSSCKMLLSQRSSPWSYGLQKSATYYRSPRQLKHKHNFWAEKAPVHACTRSSLHAYCTLLPNYKSRFYDTSRRCQSFKKRRDQWQSVATLYVPLVMHTSELKAGWSLRVFLLRYTDLSVFLSSHRYTMLFTMFFSDVRLIFSSKTICGRCTGFAPSSALTTHFLLPNYA